MSLQDIVSDYPSIADISNYWRHYGLTRDPFSIGVDSEMYFPLPRWEEHLDLMQYLCNYNNVLIVVTGLSGCGKSTFRQQFVSQLAADTQVCEVSVEAGFDVTRCMELMAERFGLPWHPELSLQEQADAILNKAQAQSDTFLLVFDQAHLLPVQLLELFLYFVRGQSEAQMRLRIVLLGEPKVSDLLQTLMAEDDEQLVHFLQLEPLDLEETGHYLTQRMSAAGWDGDIPFSREALARIYRLSEGIPSRINRVSRRALLDLINKQQSEQEGFWLEHRSKILGAVLLCLVFGGVLWFFGRSQQAPHLPKPPKAETAHISFSEAPPAPPHAAPPAASPVLPPPPQKIEMPPPPPPVPVENSTLPVTAPPAPIIKAEPPKPVPQKPVAAKHTPAPAPIVSKKPAVHAPVVASVPAAKAAPVAVAAPSPSSQNLQHAESSLLTGHADKKADTVKAVKKTPVAPAKAHAPEAAAPAAKKGKWTADEKELLAMKAADYSLQVIGLSRESGIRDIMAKHHLKGKAWYFRTQLNGKDFYILLYGHYATRQEASLAAANLPADLKTFKPWPRQLNRVHETLKNRK